MARRRYYYYYLLATAAYFFTGCGVAAPVEATAIVEIPFINTTSLPGETVGWSRYQGAADQGGVPDEAQREGETERWKWNIGLVSALLGLASALLARFPNLISKGNKNNQQAVSRIQEEHDQTRQEIGRFLAKHEDAREKVDQLQNEVRRLLKVHDDTREEVRDLADAQGKALKRSRRDFRILLMLAFGAFVLIASLWMS